MGVLVEAYITSAGGQGYISVSEAIVLTWMGFKQHLFITYYYMKR